ncbi:hypothetical protein Hanom_Chr11g00999711 [Helianthus anomalus]
MRVQENSEPAVLSGDVFGVLNEPDELENGVEVGLLGAVGSDDTFIGGEEGVGYG